MKLHWASHTLLKGNASKSKTLHTTLEEYYWNLKFKMINYIQFWLKLSFSRVFTSIKCVFINDKKWCIYRNSFGVNTIINSNKICIYYNMRVLNFHIITNRNLIWVDNGVDAEAVPVNTSFLIINKDAFYWGENSGKTIISIRTVYHYAPPNYSSHQTFMINYS